MCKNICEYMLDLESKYTDEKISNMVNKLTNFEVNEKNRYNLRNF